MSVDPSQESLATGLDDATKWLLRIEKRKAQFDYLKHLSTLSSGTMLIVSAFTNKIFETPQWKPLIIISLFGFLASIVGSVAWYTVAVGNFPFYKDRGAFETTSLVTAWLGFLLGMTFLSFFAMGNF